MDESTGSFVIRFKGSDADAGDSATVNLYYDSDTDPANGKALIVSGLPIGQGSYTWNTANVTPGVYYIYAETTDGMNTTSRYSTGPVQVTSGGQVSSSLTVTVNGSGSVASSPAGIACGVNCARSFTSGSRVTLTPTPGPGSVFSGWLGSSDCQDGEVTLNGTVTCTAVFVPYLPRPATPGSIDLNGDGGGDVFRYRPTTGEWSMDFSNRGGNFASRSGTWSLGWEVKPADFNADGLTDFLLYNPTTGTAYMLVNNGGDFTYSRADWSLGWNITVLDFDGDGRSDLLLYNPKTGVWFQAVNMGLGIDQFAYTTGNPWDPGFTITTGDFNGDRRADLFLYHPAAGTWWEVLTTPSLGFAYYGPGIMSSGWAVTVNDFNGDGRSDVFLYRSTDGLWFEALTTGLGTFDWSRTGTWDPGFEVSRGDFNGDGRGDLFLYHPVAGTWWEVLSNGAGPFDYFGGVMSPGWTATVADLNGDRKSDVVLYSPSTGTWFQALSIAPQPGFVWVSGTWTTGWTIIGSRTTP
jgi:hypothetical protein